MKYIIEVGKIISNKNNKTTINNDILISADTNKQYVNSEIYFNESKLLNNLSPLLISSINLDCGIKNNVSKETLNLYLNSFLKSSLIINKLNWIDCALSFNIISQSSISNKKILKIFLQISNPNKNHNDSFYKKDNKSYNNSKDIYNEFGFKTWCWELACHYLEVLTYICVTTSNGLIRKLALLGYYENAKEAITSNEDTVFSILECTKFKSLVPHNSIEQDGKIFGFFLY